MVLFWILASTFLVSLISLVGIFTLAIKDNLLHKILFCLIGFSAGALIGGAFLHLIPEAVELAAGAERARRISQEPMWRVRIVKVTETREVL